MISLLRLLRLYEGFVPYAYRDSEGYLTIGIGRLIDKRRGGGITEDEAYYLLRNDIKVREIDLDSNLPWWRSQNSVRQMAMLSMCFQLGIEGLLKFKNMLEAWKNGEYERAAAEALDSKWASQTPLRARDTAYMIRYGIVPPWLEE